MLLFSEKITIPYFIYLVSFDFVISFSKIESKLLLFIWYLTLATELCDRLEIAQVKETPK